MIRAVGLRQAIAMNAITMIGIGPLITVPLVLSALHGPAALLGWIVGALVALCDGMVWAELGSLYPGTGSTYRYLRESFGAHGPGSLLSFLFVWQFTLSAPLFLASGYIGFAQYASYLWPAIGSRPLVTGAVAALVGVLTMTLLYRNIVTVAKLTIVLWIGALLTLVLVTVAAFSHADFARVVTFVPGSVGFNLGFFFGLGSALLITLYDYAGYNDVCAIGDEVREPVTTIPRAIVISIVLIAILYILMNVGILAAIPWQSVVASAGADPPPDAKYIASRVVEQAWGKTAAGGVTLLILWTAFASTFGLLLGFSRIPYAAALDGAYFAPFAKLHPRGRFPYVALLVIGTLALPFSFLSLDAVIAALTTGLLIVQNIGQVAAVFFVRSRGAVPPFRMWLYPLPALVALLAWVYVFVTAGTSAIVFGVLSLGCGLIAYALWAKRGAHWPFAKIAAAMLLAIGAACAAPGSAQAAAFTSSAIVQDHGYPVFTVAGKPFFVWGAAFFYERMPAAQWRSNMQALKALGVNTIDLYVMWNWHELADGDFDFDGHTNPRRNLRKVLRLAKELGFYVTLRPGPVIRNEWRNGGYPDWLLRRPEYGMPLHDILEGRYPATATLQNAHSDDAAAEWMRNATHMRYSERWLKRVLTEASPWADRIIAVQLDDDQGAYIDNQTWPAPHLRRYLEWLRSVVHSVTGPKMPVFINTYQMKVSASSPVWAWGNWYQSDARVIGEHDRSQLEFSSGLLQTQPHLPLMMSEFQAGWLQPPEDIRARETDPSNTLLALHTFLSMGGHGIIDFPMQDTINPAGWEAPFSNSFYSWNAALGVNGEHNPRYEATKRFGELIAQYGSQLARTHRVADAAIAYLTSAYDENTISNDQIFDIAGRTQEAQQFCRSQRLTCDLVDLRYADDPTLARYPFLILPVPAFAAKSAQQFIPQVQRTLERYVAKGGSVFAQPSFGQAAEIARTMLMRSHHTRVVERPDTTKLEANDGSFAFFDVVKYGKRSATLRRVPRAGTHDQLHTALEPLRANAGTTLPLRSDVQWPFVPAARAPGDGAIVYAQDVYADGYPADILENGVMRVVVSPAAGARAFVLQDRGNVFTTVGALRDDVLIQPPPSTTDRIAKYTHSFPAGFFNRAYRCSPRNGALDCVYDAPDVLPHGAHIEKTFSLAPDSHALVVDESATFAGDEQQARDQRLVSYTSLAVGDTTAMSTPRYVLTPAPQPFAARRSYDVAGDGAIGFYDAATHELATVTWPSGDVQNASVQSYDYSLVSKLVFAAGQRRSVYGYFRADSLADAERRLRALAKQAAGGRSSAWAKARSVGEVAERSTQPPQKRPGESPCGFKSHLPQVSRNPGCPY